MDECSNPLVGGDEEGDTTSKGKKRKQHIKSEAPEVPEKKIKDSSYCKEGATSISTILQEPTSQVHKAVTVPVLEDIQPKSILPKPICTPKPVKITIINQLSTLVFVAPSVASINPSLKLQSITKQKQNLCALCWLKQIKRGGKTDEFNNYYRSLTPDQCGVAEDMWIKNVNEGHVY
ncbi:hypothetical protein BDR06DRAFT_974768 [Suillus hirtellus]|nr:hypothetical protein BDR06DRAFT_974768 [Suillus hirtellus]